ncbi:hypothetical protein LCGC14_2067170 [marine sediment metagenome]|uniref:Uncharacterized protein n=1 Tax=marine sediment metagenome TaxID=412755 RepID=A0A0F9HGF5_9ZZZZ
MREWCIDIIIGTVIAFIVMTLLVWTSVIVSNSPCGG